MHLLESLARWSWETSLAATVLILPVLVAQLILRRPIFASLRHALGLLIVARLLLPFTPSSSLSIFNFLPKHETTFANPQSIPAATAPIANPSPIQTPPPFPTATTTPIPTTTTVHHHELNPLPILWLAGVAFLLLRVAIQHHRLRGALQHAAPLSSDLLPARVRLYVVPHIPSPALFGLLRPAILIPQQVYETSTPQTLRLIILHELAHHRRFDVLTNWFMILAQSLHWFNPLVWLALRRLRAEQELLCDADVMRQLQPAERQTYGETLLALAAPAAQPLSPAIPLSSSFQQMKERVIMIKQFKPAARRLAFLVILPLATIIATLTFTAAVSKPPLLKPASAPTASTDSPSDAEKGIQILQKHLHEMDDQLRVLEKEATDRGREYFNGQPENATEAFQETREGIKNLERERIQAEENYIQLAKLHEELSKMSPNQLRDALPTASHDDNLDRLLQERARTEQQLAVMQNDYGDEHRDVVRSKSLLKNIDTQIAQRVEGIMTGMKAMVQARDAVRKTLTELVEREKIREAQLREKSGPYFKARRDLETMQKLRDSIQIRILQETVDAKVAKGK